MSEQSGIIEMKEPETPKSAPKEKESIIDTTVISEAKTAKTVNHSSMFESSVFANTKENTDSFSKIGSDISAVQNCALSFSCATEDGYDVVRIKDASKQSSGSSLADKEEVKATPIKIINTESGQKITGVCEQKMLGQLTQLQI